MENEKYGYGLTGSLIAKVGAFILAVICAVMASIGAAASALMINQDFYGRSENEILDDALTTISDRYASRIAHEYVNYMSGANDVVTYDTGTSGDRINDAEISDTERLIFMRNIDAVIDGTNITGFIIMNDVQTEVLFEHGDIGGSRRYRSTIGISEDAVLSVDIFLADDLTVDDDFSEALRIIGFFCGLRYAVYPIIAVSSIILLIMVVFLAVSTGRHRGAVSPSAGWGTAVPFDIVTAALAAAYLAVAMIFADARWSLSSMAAFAVTAVVLFMLTLGWMMSFALRIKLGRWWKNTVIFMLLRSIFRGLKALCGGIVRLFRAVPVVWKRVLVYICISFLSLIVLFMISSSYSPDAAIFVWIIANLIAFPVTVFRAFSFRALLSGVESLADGDLEHKIDTKHFIGSYKKHAECLNRISDGMTKAVDERMRSERMKTELITNVSHDIKTPLTSIINYADLICREDCENPKITQYAEVLHRQSERLKRLINDLVEASKAATGNLDVSLSPCEVGVLMIQAAGEFERRFVDAGLTMVIKRPEHPVYIMADGRRLWRVFDNLLGNIVKYAMPGTRVWLTVSRKDGYVEICFRNISAEPLDLSEEELLERFTRGDRSRSSEGSGLGLSIAKSLTELQNGRLGLSVDGDLFKVTLSFPETEPPRIPDDRADVRKETISPDAEKASAPVVPLNDGTMPESAEPLNKGTMSESSVPLNDGTMPESAEPLNDGTMPESSVPSDTGASSASSESSDAETAFAAKEPEPDCLPDSRTEKPAADADFLNGGGNLSGEGEKVG